MIIIQLLGGLGNQMFQYALGRHLALLNNTELKLDTSILLNWSPGKHEVNRGFDLDIFALNPLIATKNEIKSYHSDGFNLVDKIKFKIKEKIRGNLITKEIFFHYDSSILQLSGNIYLAGTWQSYRYFEDIEFDIRNDFTFQLPLSSKSEILKKRIEQSNSVCLNVRRTDYVSVQTSAEAMATIGLDYYKLALKEMEKQVGDFEVFIFSDDIDWCRKNLFFIKQPNFIVDESYAGEKYSDKLQLMIACKHYIIPNSTYAWWAAWLNNSNSKVVITPRQWFSNNLINTDDLIPISWIRL